MATPIEQPKPSSAIKPIRITPGNITPQKREMNGLERPSSRSGETDEQYEDRILRNMFRLSLDPEQKVDASMHRLHYLKGIREELVEGGQEIRMTTDLRELALMEAGLGWGRLGKAESDRLVVRLLEASVTSGEEREG
jgi:hypothetical protein